MSRASAAANDGEEKRTAPGRKDNGQPAVIKLESLQTRVDHLVKLHKAAETASTDYKEACNKVAEDAGLNAATVSKYIKARAGDRFDETKARALQLALVFEEISDTGTSGK
jgi:hypothetical protein